MPRSNPYNKYLPLIYLFYRYSWIIYRVHHCVKLKHLMLDFIQLAVFQSLNGSNSDSVFLFNTN